jgi:hypothetical protein
MDPSLANGHNLVCVLKACLRLLRLSLACVGEIVGQLILQDPPSAMPAQQPKTDQH